MAIIIGTDGNDILNGDTDANDPVDTIDGGAGDDTIDAGFGGDTVDGGPGNDTILGAPGNDDLTGGSGNDTLTGGNGNDIINGTDADAAGAGEIDELNGNGGTDTFILGDATQAYYTAAGDGDYAEITDFNPLQEIVQLKGIPSDYSLTQVGTDVELRLVEGSELIAIFRNQDVAAIDLDSNTFTYVGSGLDIVGTPGDDVLPGSDGFDIIAGGDGNDTIDGGDGRDTLNGDAGDDSITGGAGNDGISGGDNSDTIDAGEGNDSVDGGIGDDTIIGGAGDDTLLAAPGFDTVIGSAGNDSINGGGQNDILNGTDATAMGAGELDVITGGGGTDRFILGDENGAYYTAAGDADYVQINDFNVNNEVIQLHGQAADYSLVQADANTEIRYNGELIGILVNRVATDLDLNSARFEYAVPSNTAPVANSDTFTIDEDTSLTVAIADLLSNDTDADGDALSLTSVSNAVNGTVSLDGNGNVVFTPDADFFGEASFGYTISDGNGGESTATVGVTVKDVADNAAPVANPDAFTIDQDTNLTVSLDELFSNDTDVDGDQLTLVRVRNPLNGTVAVDGQNVVFTPDAGFFGEASFDYTITDGNGGKSTTTVTVTVDAPTGSIGDTIYLDANADGDQDAGEAGIGNVTVHLVDKDNGDVVIATETTDADGKYLFEELAAGNYAVVVNDDNNVLNGLIQTADPDGGLDNMSMVHLAQGEDNLKQDFGYDVAAPGIDIEKFVNGIDVKDLGDLPEIAAGDDVTFTYTVTNTGNVDFTKNQVVVVDDHGTPDQAGDDFTPTLIASSDKNGDGILSAGETWTYTSGKLAAEDLTSATASKDVQFHFSGNSYTTGHYGNTRTFISGGVSVDVSAFRSDKDGQYFDTSYLGAYSGGLGSTNRYEYGSDHRVDNYVSLDYVVFEFDQDVTVDRAFLDYVYKDSDISVWIGDRDGSNITHLSSSLLNSFTREDNFGGSYDRWADFNAAGLTGDTLIISGYIEHSYDAFKISKLDISVPGETVVGEYKNTVTVKAGGVSDSDMSGYTNPSAPVNNAPDAKDDTFHYDENEDYGYYDGNNLLSNDMDADGDSLHVTHVNGTAIGDGKWIDLGRGWVYVNKDGRIDFAANNEFDYLSRGQTASVGFDYTISDSNGGTDTAHVTIKVEGISSYSDYYYYCPITLDLNGDGIQTLSINDGVEFDMLNSGEAVSTGWLSGEDAFLAIDNDGDGLITSRAELFGGVNVGDGFAKLDSFDSNGDGLVNQGDSLFGELLVWQDANENGLTDKGELVALSSTGITDLDTSYTNVFRTDVMGNIHGEHSSAKLNGTVIDMVDVYFQVAI